MLFNSFAFLVFFPVAFAAWWLTPPAWRWLAGLACSYAFYMAWEPVYGLLLLLSTAIDFVVAGRMSATTSEGARRAWLLVSLVSNLGLLFFFKYYNLVAETLNFSLSWLNLPQSSLLLPVGISFYTFQTLAYSIDVYRGHLPAERHFGRFALYVAFWPQLVAGPIERAGRLLPQLHRAARPSALALESGLRLVTWGFFKKLVVGDHLSQVVAAVFDQPEQWPGPIVILASFLFGFSVYCDFSGYSDIAVGTARMLGVDLSRNFLQPFLASSMREHWARWHITLSHWFRDYLYIPLGGNRGSAWASAGRVLLVFWLCGMWHGAGWSFGLWGLANGAALVVERALQAPVTRIARVLGLSTEGWLADRFGQAWQLSAVTVSYVFFRADDLAHAERVFAGWAQTPGRALTLEPWVELARAIGGGLGWLSLWLLMVPLVEALDQAMHPPAEAEVRRPLRQWAADLLLLFAVLSLGEFSAKTFFYFQF